MVWTPSSAPVIELIECEPDGRVYSYKKSYLLVDRIIIHGLYVLNHTMAHS